MDKNTFIERIKEIGLCEDDVNRRTLLASLETDISGVFDSLEENTNTINSLNNTIEKNNSDMEDLRKANLELFKKVGSNVNTTKEDLGIEPEKEKLKYEDLFKNE